MNGIDRGIQRAGWCAALAMLLTMVLPAPVVAQSDPAYQQFLFAYRLLQSGDDRLAIEAFDDYLGKFPRHAMRGDGLYYRALLARKQSDNTTAARLLRDAPAPQVVPTHAVTLLHGQALHDLGEHRQALAVLETLEMDKLDATSRASAQLLLGRAYRGAGNAAAAIEALGRAGDIDSPLRARALLDKARLEAQSEQMAEAIDTLDRAVAVGEGAVAAEAARLGGDLAYQVGRYPTAISFYRTVLTRHQATDHFGPSVLGLLWSQFAAGQHRPLLESYQQFNEALSGEDRLIAGYLAGSALQALGEHEKAIPLFEAVVGSASSVQDKALLKLAASQFEISRYDAMRRTIQTLMQRLPDSPLTMDALFLLASADARQGDVARGAARLTEIVAKGQAHPYYFQALLQRARLYEQNNQLRPAVEDYVQYLKEATYEEVDQGQDGRPIVRATQEQADVFVRLLDLAYRVGMYPFTEGLTAQWLAQVRMTPLVEQEAMYRRALALIKLNQHEEALQWIDRLEDQHPQHRFGPEAQYYRGLLLMSLGKADEAVIVLRTAAQRQGIPEALRINALRLAAVRLRDRGDALAASEAIMELESLVGVSHLTTHEQLWMGRHLLEHNRAELGLTYLRPLAEASPNAPAAQRAEALYLTGLCRRSLGRTEEAMDHFRHVVAMGAGFELQARLALAQTLVGAGRDGEALSEYEGLINAEASRIAAEALMDTALIHRRMAREASWKNDAAAAREHNIQARRLLKRLVLLYSFEQLQPLPQQGYVLLAEVARDLDEPDAAAEELEQLQTKHPDGPYAQYGRAVTLQNRADREGARFILRKLRDSDGLDPMLIERVTARLKELEGN